MYAVIDISQFNFFQKALLWIVQHFPFSYQISGYLSDKFGIPGLPGVSITDSYGSFSAVLVGVLLLALLKLLISFLSKKIFRPSHQIIPPNPGSGSSSMTDALIFPNTLTEQLFGSYEKKKVWARIILWFAGLVAAFVCGVVADLICAPIGNYISSKLPQVPSSMSSGYMISFLIFLIMFIIFSAAYAVIIYLKRKISADNIEMFNIMKQHAGYPVIRLLITNVLPDVLSIVGTHFWAILSFMFFCAGNTVNGLISLLAMALWYVLSQCITELLERRVKAYYTSYTVMHTVSALFTLLEEAATVLIFYAITVSPQSDADLKAISGFDFPFAECFRNSMSWRTLTLQIGTAELTRRIITLLLFLAVYIILNRLVTNLFTTAVKKASILLTILLWWVKVSFLFIISLLITRGMIYVYNTVDAALAAALAVLLVLVLFYCSPPLLQHIVLIFIFILAATLLAEATGFMSETYLFDEGEGMRYIFTVLLLFVTGDGLALIHVLTWPSPIASIIGLPVE